MKILLGASLLCVASVASAASVETFIIETAHAGHESTIKMPAAAIARLSADRAESLETYAGVQVEAMRLSGAVSISITGSAQPIEIKADTLVLELTGDDSPGDASPGTASPGTAAARAAPGENRATVPGTAAGMAPGELAGRGQPSRADAATHRVLRFASGASAAEDSQVFLGHVVFDLQTASGPVQIKADKIEYQSGSESGA